MASVLKTVALLYHVQGAEFDKAEDRARVYCTYVQGIYKDYATYDNVNKEGKSIKVDSYAFYTCNSILECSIIAARYVQ